jgi:hypothetical protein
LPTAIVNSSDHPIVIGLYTPSKDGISEKLVNVPPKTELYDVPIPVTDNAQFVIAYCATTEGDQVRRAKPIEICGHKRLRFLKDGRRQITRDAMIVYRGGYEPRSFDFNNALWLPDYHIEAQNVLRRANQTSKIMPTPLTRTEPADGTDSQQAAPFVRVDDSSEIEEQIHDALIRATKDADADVRIAAFRVLLGQRRSDAVVAAFREGLQDPHVNVRLISLAGVVRSEGPTDEVVRLLVSLLAQELMRESAKGYLVQFGATAIPAVEEALDEEETRLVAIEILGKLGRGERQAEVAVRLIPQLDAEDAAVRLATVQALAELLSGKPAQSGSLDSRFLRYYQSLIKKYDLNKDDKLTEDEWKAMSRNPAEADKNNDGEVTAEELMIWATRK